jgi:DNA invertase Pin-like site-specific DNA recombinase
VFTYAPDASPKFVAYYRVSTEKQASSGLGLDAQRSAVLVFVKSRNGSVVAEFQEVESGRVRARPELKRALAECARLKATLVIARLDRLARNLYVIASLMEARVEFVAADMPSANKLTIQLIAAIAEHERDQISKNTKAALRAAKDRGVVLGNPRLHEARVAAVRAKKIKAYDFARKMHSQIQLQGIAQLSLNKIAQILNAQGIETQRGNAWTATGVRNIIITANSALAEAQEEVKQIICSNEAK